MNKAILVGRLTKDPDMRNANGKAVAQFTLAINRRFANAQGVREADFIPVVVWDKAAESCGKYLYKGSRVSVVGRIQTRSFEGKNGKQYVTEVIAEEVNFLNDAPKTEQGSRPAPKPQNVVEQMEELPDEELPF